MCWFVPQMLDTKSGLKWVHQSPKNTILTFLKVSNIKIVIIKGLSFCHYVVSEAFLSV